MKQKIKHPFRDTFLTRHHITAKFYGGTGHPSNILKLWEDKHRAWHQIFGLHKLPHIIDNFYLFRFYNKRPQWKLIFGNRTDFACMSLLRRVLRMKNSLKKKGG